MCSPHVAISLDPRAIISSETVWSNINYLKWGKRDKSQAWFWHCQPVKVSAS